MTARTPPYVEPRRRRLARLFGRLACAIEGRHPIAEWDAWWCPRCDSEVKVPE